MLGGDNSWLMILLLEPQCQLPVPCDKAWPWGSLIQRRIISCMEPYCMASRSNASTLQQDQSALESSFRAAVSQRSVASSQGKRTMRKGSSSYPNDLNTLLMQI